MRCFKFERTAKLRPISSADTSLPPTITTSKADLARQSKRTTASLAKAPPQVSTITQTLKVPSTLKEKLIAPITAVGVETTTIKIQTVTRGQSTQSQDTQTVKTEMISKTAPQVAEFKPSGRHPNPPTGSNKKLKHVCPFDGCPWRFATPYKLRRHIKSHTKETPYLCKECGRGFSVRYNLLMHIQTIHSQPQRFKCPVRGCKEAFHSQPRLNGHLRRVHKRDVKATEKQTSRCDSRGNSTSSMESVGEDETVRTSRQRRKYECLECGKEFTSQAKLNGHARVHSKEKVFKCSAQGCEETFPNKEKLSKHSESHKNGRQFTCPHDNCNRVFLHHSHLKNHLKIHTKDHQFICPVIDCNKKFSSEQDYNIHLNTHINYGYQCPHPGCELSFLSQKRLAFHIQVNHGNTLDGDGAQSNFLEGIQPHLGVNHQTSQLISPLPCPPVFTYTGLPHEPIKSELSNYVDTEFIKDLPNSSQKSFESILHQNKDWSGKEIDQFLHSAIDLSEIESQLCSSTSYESDSGYSTYDVSPTATRPPMSLSHPLQSLSLQHSAAGPMFNPGCCYSPTSTVFADGLHSTTSSPCSTEAGFFSPHTDLESMVSTPNQMPPFFSGELTQGIQMYPQPPSGMFGNSYYIEHHNSLPGQMQVLMNSRVPDVLMHSAGHLDQKGNDYLDCCRNSDENMRGHSVTCSLPNMGQLAHIKSENQYECSMLHLNADIKKEEGGQKHSCSVAASESSYQTSYSNINTRATTMKHSQKKKSNRSARKNKNQWPRSMNKASMMAFRQHILNKLKKGQESATESSTVKQEATSPKALSDQELGRNLDTNNYEVQVEFQQNHLTENRCHSEPINSSNSPKPPLLQQSHSDIILNKDGPLGSTVCGGNTNHLNELLSDDIFDSFNFNPDSLLSKAEEEHMLKTLGFDESDDEIANLLGVSGNSLIPNGSTSSEMMDLDCIQELLESDEVSSPLSLPSIHETPLGVSIFNPSSPQNASPLSHDSTSLVTSSITTQPLAFSSVHISTAPQYTIPAESMVRLNDSVSSSSTVYQVQSGLLRDFETCASEVFNL